MRVALYHNHHHLPFWHHPQNPFALYAKNMLADWSFDDRFEWDKIQNRPKQIPAQDHFMVPVLEGLLALALPGVLAHVSFSLDLADKKIGATHRIWIQITNEVKENDVQGLPIVVKGNKIQVIHLWGGDNGTRTPYDFTDAPSAENAPPLPMVGFLPRASH